MPEIADMHREQGSPPQVARAQHSDTPIAVVGATIEALQRLSITSQFHNPLIRRTITGVAVQTPKQVTLELGGKSRSVVLDDTTDKRLAQAVKITASTCFLDGCQTCTATTSESSVLVGLGGVGVVAVPGRAARRRIDDHRRRPQHRPCQGGGRRTHRRGQRNTKKGLTSLSTASAHPARPATGGR